MKKRIIMEKSERSILFLFTCYLMMVLNACAAAPTPTSTPTIEVPSVTPTSTSTSTYTPTPLPPTATATPAIPLYMMQCAASGMFMTAQDGAGVAGSAIVQNPTNGSSDQLWRITNLSGEDDGFFLIQSSDGSQCLDTVGGEKYQEGRKLLQNPCDSSDGQKWKSILCTEDPGWICDILPGSMWLQDKLNQRVIDLPGESQALGESINSFHEMNGSLGQQWLLIEYKP